MEMLAEFFGIRAEYFDSNTGYARALDVELDWLHLAHDETVRDLTTALMTLTPSLRDELLGPTTAMSQNNRGFSAPAVEGRQERLSAEQLEKTSPPSLDDYPIIKCGR
ncbi:MAG: hypothetical protein P4L86_30930 [Mycobacterium sp.]|nr:hypothetical protein [Mycobacterium sp.]